MEFKQFCKNDTIFYNPSDWDNYYLSENQLYDGIQYVMDNFPIDKKAQDTLEFIEFNELLQRKKLIYSQDVDIDI